MPLPRCSLSLALLASLSRSALAQNAANTDLQRMAGCTLQGRTYTCSKADLRRAVYLSTVIKTVSQPANHASDAALTDLVKALGKTLATADAAPDLTVILEPLQEAGVQVGAGAVDLARLRVLSTAPDGGPGKLLWVETYAGDPSMPWAAIARAVTLALRDQLRPR